MIFSTCSSLSHSNSSPFTFFLLFFHFLQFFSNFLKYSSLNSLSSHPYNNLAVYLPGNSILLYLSTSFFLSIFFCRLTSISSFLNFSINSFVFFRFSLLFYISPSTINPFYHTRYFSTPLIFFLFKIFSISYSLTSSTSIGFPSSFFYLFTCFLYRTIQLTFTTR